MHPDEKRSLELLDAQKAEELTDNPVRLLEQYYSLADQAAGDADRIADLEHRISLFKKVATERDRLKKQLATEQAANADERERRVAEFKQVAIEREDDEREKASLKRAVADLKDQKVELFVDLARHEERANELARQVDSLQKDSTERDRLRERFASERASWEFEREQLKVAFERVVGEREGLKTDLASRHETASELETQNLDLLVGRARDEARIEMLRREVETFARRVAEHDALWERLVTRERRSADELVDLQRRLSAAQGGLHTYRLEIEALRGTVKLLRESRSMRLGRSILAPFEAMRGNRRRPAGSQRESTREALVADEESVHGDERQ